MTKAEFWQLIGASKATAGDDQPQQAQLLIARLAEHAPEHIIEFECLLREYLREADHYQLMAAQRIIDGYVSDDTYVYFRCWLVAQGETVFQNALHAPDSLAAVIQDPYQEFETLLYVATEAFGRRTGQAKEDETFPREVAAARRLDYDLGAETQGEDWTEAQLPKLLPRLWKKFGG